MSSVLLQLLLICLPLLAIAALWFFVAAPTNATAARLRGLRQRAAAAHTLAEVQAAWTELTDVGKDCWHRDLLAEANVIAAILRTKHAFYADQSC